MFEIYKKIIHNMCSCVHVFGAFPISLQEAVTIPVVCRDSTDVRQPKIGV